MTVLSPKSLRFIAMAIEEVGDSSAKAAWRALDKDASNDIPPAARRAARIALSEYERRLRAALERPDLDEDEAADIANDIGTVCAIERTLEQAL
jgi:hypothetical protein